MNETYLVTVYYSGDASLRQMESFIKDSVERGGDNLASNNPLFGYKPCDVRHLPSGSKISMRIKEN